MDSEIQSLKEQLSRLEGSNRRIKIWGTILLLCVVIFVLLGAKQAASRTIDANEFMMHDSKGNMVAHLYSDRDGAHFVLYDASGTPTVELESGKIMIFGNDQIISLTAESGSASLILQGKNDQTISLHANANSAGLFMSRGKSDPSLTLHSDADGAYLGLLGKIDKDKLYVSVDNDGPAVELIDLQGFESHLGTTATKTIRTGEAHRTSAASLTMFGPDGKTVWSAP